MTDYMLWCDSYICKSVRMQVWEEAKFTAESFPAPYSCLPEDRVSSLGPLPATPGFPRGSRSFPAGVFQKERSPQRASHIYFILLAWAIVLVQVWFNLWILQLLPIPVAGNTHTHTHSLANLKCGTFAQLTVVDFYSSVGTEEGGGPLWSEELRRADPRLLVGGAGEARAWTRRGAVAWTNQRPGSVHAACRHQGNVSGSSSSWFSSSSFSYLGLHPPKHTGWL